MKCLVFDTGSIISLTLNNLLWLLEPLKKRYGGKFYITEAIKNELVNKPLATKRFKFEALQVLHYINNKTLEVANSEEIRQKTELLFNLANNCFRAFNNYINIVHYAEMSGLATLLTLGDEKSSLIIDERTTRILIENVKRLIHIQEHTLHTNIYIDNLNLKKFKELTSKVKVLRSFELVAVAYESGLLDSYIADIPNPKETLLDSVLWGVKLNGCAVSKDEIEEIIRMEMRM